LNTLLVWKNGRQVGELSYGQNNYIFTYVKNVTDNDAISLTMPISERVYGAQVLHPVFQQNLPEGMLAEVLRKHFGKVIDLSDDIGFLRLTGKYKTNYLQVTEVNEHPDTAPWGSIEDVLQHTGKSSVEFFHECIEKFGIASGISGMQPKVIAELRLDKKASRSTVVTDSYILKFHDDREYFGLAINEYFSLKAAEYAKIPVVTTTLNESSDCLIVSRFDKKEDDTFFCVEDFCVLQALSRQGRYKGDYLNLLETVNRFIPPSKSEHILRMLFQIIVFSMRINNGDAHLKKFALMYDENNIFLAPAYDQVCTKVYMNKDLPALEFLGNKEWPDEKELINFAEQCNVDEKETMEIINKIEKGKKSALKELEAYCEKYSQFSDVYSAIATQWSVE
jgi:serine/threonine-protein kinase HipA